MALTQDGEADWSSIDSSTQFQSDSTTNHIHNQQATYNPYTNQSNLFNMPSQQQQDDYQSHSLNNWQFPPYDYNNRDFGHQNAFNQNAFNNTMVPRYNNALPSDVRDRLNPRFGHAAPGLPLHPQQIQQQQQYQQQQQDQQPQQNLLFPAANNDAPRFRPNAQQNNGSNAGIETQGNLRPRPQSHDSAQGADTTRPTKAEAVPIPRLQSRSSATPVVSTAEEKTTAPAMGPMSKPVTMASRPKPGRKPLPEHESTDRRRKQNRDAQRNFRDKRATKVIEMQLDMDKLRMEKQKLVGEHERQMEERRKEIAKLNGDLAEMKRLMQTAEQRAQEAETRLHHASLEGQFRAGGMPNATVVSSGNAQPTWNDNIISSDPMETEFDFTWSGNDYNKPSCGFCTDGGNCQCPDAQSQPRKVAPGSCDACQLDPARAAACREIADQTMGDSKGEDNIRNDSLVEPQVSERLISCSTMIDRMGGSGQRMPSIAELFPGNFRLYGAENGMGYNVNEQEAAQVLQSMSRRNTAVSPRQQ